MLRSATLITMLAAACFSALFAAPQFPFPQQATYPNGILPAGVDHKHVQAVYDIWLKNYYEESGDQARIKFDTPAHTVSEGIGYGMLIMVYMDNYKNNTQAKFDKLWNYYQAHSLNGLMHWKIQGFTNNTPGTGAATDAELDVAVALIMADKQWGGSKYLADAKKLIGDIYTQEVKNGLLVGGSQWDALNPSYMSMVATQLFQAVDGSRWSAVQENCYSLLSKSQHSTTGMWPNWCQADGSPGGGVGANPGVYGFDASRTPWRLGWAYAWYGHPQAKTLCDKVVGWFKQKTSDTPGKIGQIYNLNGTINTGANGSDDNIPTFLGPLTIGGMVDAKYKSWVDKGYTRMRAFGMKDDNYYNECLELLSMLLLSGNMPDFTKASPKTSAKLTVNVSPSGAGTVNVSPKKDSYSINDEVEISTTNSNESQYTFVGWDGDLTGTSKSASVKVYCDMVITAVYKDTKANDLVDDCEDNDHKTKLGTEWFTYTDVADKGKSIIAPVTEKDKIFFKMAEGGYNDSKHAVKIDFTLDKGQFLYDPFVGVGFEMSKDGAPVDISASTGISFYYKGSFGTAKCALKIESKSVTESGADFAFFLPATTSWKEVNVTWDKFLQPTWAEPVELDLKTVPKFQWQIQGKTGDKGELWIDDIHLIGYKIDYQTNIGDRKRVTGLKDSKLLSVTQKDAVINVTYSAAKAGNAKISVYNLNGKLIIDYSQYIHNPGLTTFTFNNNNSGFSTGSYILYLTTDNKSYSHQFVVNK